jgi:hypothetical protein
MRNRWKNLPISGIKFKIKNKKSFNPILSFDFCKDFLNSANVVLDISNL